VDEPTVAGLDEGSDDALALDDDGSIDINTDSSFSAKTSSAARSEGRPAPSSAKQISTSMPISTCRRSTKARVRSAT